jgi:hypothetical protein
MDGCLEVHPRIEEGAPAIPKARKELLPMFDAI